MRSVPSVRGTRISDDWSSTRCYGRWKKRLTCSSVKAYHTLDYILLKIINKRATKIRIRTSSSEYISKQNSAEILRSRTKFSTAETYVAYKPFEIEK